MNNWQYKLKQFWLFILANIKIHQHILKIICVILGVILILLILAVGFLYFNFYFKKDRMIRYVPENAVLYAAFNAKSFNDNNLISSLLGELKQKYELANLDPSYLNQWVGENVAIAVIPKSEGDFYKFDYVLLFDLNKKPDEAWLSRQNLDYTYLENDFLNKDILAIGSSPAVIGKVIAVRNQEEYSLAQRLGVAMGIQNIGWSGIGKIFIDAGSLSDHYSQISDPKLKLFLSSIHEEGIGNLYLGVGQENQKIIMSNLDSSVGLGQPVLSEVPDGFEYSLNFESGSNKLIKLLSLVDRIDPKLYQQILKNMEYSQGLLNLDWQNDILPLFNNQTQLVSYSGNHYIAAVKIASGDDLGPKLSKLEQIITTAFAVGGSREVQKKMADGTYITQIIRSKDQNFQDLTENGHGLRILSTPNAEFGYYSAGDKLILANSIDLLKNLANLTNPTAMDDNKMANLSTNLTVDGKFLQNGFNIIGISQLNLSEQDGKFSLILQ